MTTETGFVLWFTGLSGAGKSTLASLVAAELRGRGVHVEVLDGDEVRTHLSRGLGFSREDRDTNVRRIGFVAKLMARAGSACAVTAAISPYRETRDEQRRTIGRFVEVYLRCPIPALAARDPKGLYEKALAGEIRNFTGIDDPYEPPLAAEIELDTGELGAAACVARIIERLEGLGYLTPVREDTEGLAAPYGELPVFAKRPRARPRSMTTPDANTLRWIASGRLNCRSEVRSARRIERASAGTVDSRTGFVSTSTHTCGSRSRQRKARSSRSSTNARRRSRRSRSKKPTNPTSTESARCSSQGPSPSALFRRSAWRRAHAKRSRAGAAVSQASSPSDLSIEVMCISFAPRSSTSKRSPSWSRTTTHACVRRFAQRSAASFRSSASSSSIFRRSQQRRTSSRARSHFATLARARSSRARTTPVSPRSSHRPAVSSASPFDRQWRRSQRRRAMCDRAGRLLIQLARNRSPGLPSQRRSRERNVRARASSRARLALAPPR